ncbi:hypothetical protein TKK_0018895 [Trichogramma kaykai]|uniref:Uncharacterized protein n=1 Tax=Trichogramma kaykai TaxID=54128 RepID=A0ABD2VVJ7_9HYME
MSHNDRSDFSDQSRSLKSTDRTTSTENQLPDSLKVFSSTLTQDYINKNAPRKRFKIDHKEYKDVITHCCGNARYKEKKTKENDKTKKRKARSNSQERQKKDLKNSWRTNQLIIRCLLFELFK